MTQNHTKTPILLDPMLINLRHQLRLHFDHIIPLIANQSGLSIIQAKNLCHHINDAVLIFLLKTYQDNPNYSTHKFNHRIHHLLHETPIDTTTLTRLPKVSIESLFGNQSTEVMRRIATLSNLYLINSQNNTPSETPDIATTQNISEYIAAISLHHIDVLAHDGGLDDNERRQWFALQKVFLKDKINILVWASLAGYQLDTPQNNYHDYRQKLGKVDIVFDDSEYQLPNSSWLLNLAQTIQEKHQKPLRIGHITHLKLNTDDKPTLNPSAKPAINPLVVIAAILLALVAVAGIARLLTKKQPAPVIPVATKPVQTKTQALGHQDIAVIRVDDDKLTKAAAQLPQKTDDISKNKSDNQQKNTDKPKNQDKQKDMIKKEVSKPATKAHNSDKPKKESNNQQKSTKTEQNKTQSKDTPNKNSQKTTKDKTANKTAQDKKVQNNKKDTDKKTSKQNQPATNKAPSGNKVESATSAQKTTKDKTANKTAQDKKKQNSSNTKNQPTTPIKTTPASQPAQQKSTEPMPTTPKTPPSNPQKPTESVVLRQSKNNPNSYHNNTATPSAHSPKNNPNPPNINPIPPSKNKPDE